MNLLATLFMTQLMYVIGVGGTEVSQMIDFSSYLQVHVAYVLDNR